MISTILLATEFLLGVALGQSGELAGKVMERARRGPISAAVVYAVPVPQAGATVVPTVVHTQSDDAGQFS
jgi:hypothetical protein